MTDRTGEWQTILRATRPHGDTRPISKILKASRKPDDSCPLGMIRRAMEGVQKTAKVLRNSEGSYTSIHGGFTDAERDDLDSRTSKYIAECGEQIDKLNAMIDMSKCNSNEKAHMKVLKSSIILT